MTLRQYLLLMSVGTALCWLIWLMVIANINPEEGNLIGFLFFYSSLFGALVGTFSVIGFIIKKKANKNDLVVFHHVHHTFRQGILIGLLVVSALIMMQLKFLNLTTGIILLIFFLFLESLIFAGRKYKNKL
ncbi:MAG: hypothetical protein COU31_00800 [Candidatus Magasanikbacteria bacterium CG10_big_fil_rev_8_21_14_0_10_40_10]|uniref:Uncharacterized protein n=1 Tax=Candidatus Magasanikbacteria bacterium CG10_big_fil_rev_8_21_14_0_10_40_10 TaxID=1974648 RepID=A0A2M6W540_9BACT|nr:MAG: hypothetical protein COU31_00800 [Candidatus Magasanikbacteria bacterium CG10_big_fil_rev_8_21_14_0_10_40_10]